MLKLPIQDKFLQVGIAFALGFGVIAHSIFVLGMLGLFTRQAMVILLFLAGIWSAPIWYSLLVYLPPSIIRAIDSWKTQTGWIKGFSILLTAILLLTLFQALTPPWDYDALLYHLQGPRLFLDMGKIAPLPENWLTYYPFTIEMIYTLALSLGSDVTTKLIHLSFAFLLVLVTYSLGQKVAEKTGGWLASMILATIPIFPIWTASAGIDMAWALFEVISLYALLYWRENGCNRCLVLAGILSGLAAGTKYLSLGGILVSGLWILIQSRKSNLRTLLSNGFIYGITATIICSPWYLKNLFWTGNPIYPFFFTKNGPLLERVAQWIDYMHNFGAGRSVVDYLVLPANIYINYESFGTFMGSIELPSLIFPIIIVYPWLKKHRLINGIFLFAFLRFILWALGSQQTRFLLPIFPLLSVISAYTLIHIKRKFRENRTITVVGKSLCYGIFIVGIFYSLSYFTLVKPFGVILGLESKNDFLSRMIHDYQGMRYIQEHTPSNTKVMMLWDGRGYYCDQRCIPDIDHAQWSALVYNLQTRDKIVAALNEQGITHLLFSLEDVDFNLIHDTNQRNLNAYLFLRDDFLPLCGKQVYQDEWVSIYQITCK